MLAFLGGSLAPLREELALAKLGKIWLGSFC